MFKECTRLTVTKSDYNMRIVNGLGIYDITWYVYSYLSSWKRRFASLVPIRYTVYVSLYILISGDSILPRGNAALISTYPIPEPSRRSLVTLADVYQCVTLLWRYESLSRRAVSAKQPSLNCMFRSDAVYIQFTRRPEVTVILKLWL